MLRLSDFGLWAVVVQGYSRAVRLFGGTWVHGVQSPFLCVRRWSTLLDLTLKPPIPFKATRV